MFARAEAPGHLHGDTARSVVDVLLVVFLLTMPLVNVLGPAIVLTPPVAAAGALFGWLALTKRLRVDAGLILVLGIALLCFIPWIWSAGYLGAATFVHAASFLMAATLYYGAVRCGLDDVLRRDGAGTVLKAYYAGLLLTSVFILFEAAATNLGGIDVNALVPYVEVPDFRAKIFGVYMRPRGFATEPGVMALYYDFGLFFVLPLLSRWRYRLGYLLVILPGYLLLFSAASWVCCALVAAVLVLRRLWRRFCSTAAGAALVVALGIAVLVPLGEAAYTLGEELLGGRIAAFTGGEADTSGSERVARYAELGEVLTIRPFGIGFGITPGLEDAGGLYEGLPLAPGQISLPVAIATSGGPLAALALAGLVAVLLVRVAPVPKYGVPIAAGGTAVALHHLFLTEYWLPFFWFALAAAAAFTARYRAVGSTVARRRDADVEP